jgi:hypothetical protein
VIDTNYDETLIKIYSGVPYLVIYGKARIGTKFDRFEIFEWSVEMGAYTKVEKERLTVDFPFQQR